jgi:hypothetical protein
MALLPLSSATEDHNKLTQHFSERELDAESSVKPGDKNEDTLRINRGAIRVPSPNPSLISIDDSNNIRLGRNPDYDPVYHERFVSRSPAPPRTIKGRIQAFWKSNKGLALVLISQLFGTLMNVTTRMLEMEGNDGGPTREDAMISHKLILLQAKAIIPSRSSSPEWALPLCAHHSTCGTRRRSTSLSACGKFARCS